VMAAVAAAIVVGAVEGLEVEDLATEVEDEAKHVAHNIECL